MKVWNSDQLEPWQQFAIKQIFASIGALVPVGSFEAWIANTDNQQALFTVWALSPGCCRFVLAQLQSEKNEP